MKSSKTYLDFKRVRSLMKIMKLLKFLISRKNNLEQFPILLGFLLESAQQSYLQIKIAWTKLAQPRMIVCSKLCAILSKCIFKLNQKLANACCSLFLLHMF